MAHSARADIQCLTRARKTAEAGEGARGGQGRDTVGHRRSILRNSG